MGSLPRLALAGLGCLLGFAACAGPPAAGEDEEERVVAVVETVRAAELVPRTEGLAHEVRLTLVLAPVEPWTLEVLGLRPAGQAGDDAQLEVRVKWTDYLGLQPVSWGKSYRTAIPFGDDAEATATEPLRRSFLLPIDPPEERVLARRVEAWARLHPVDLWGPAVRSGGASLEFPTVRTETFRRRPERSLEELLSDEAAPPDDVFLAAVTRSPEQREATIALLVEALPGLSEPRREPLFGALQYLTGETQGRSVARWREWIGARERAQP